MSLLYQIQESVVQESCDLGSVLLKLRLLASRLGSDILEEWVKHESEGYPKEVEVPSYRIVEVSYKGTFSGAFGSGIQNAPIPSLLIQEIAGQHWVNHEIRTSISSVDDTIKNSADADSINIDASNPILLLQGKIYPGYPACHEIKGTISPISFIEIRQAVKSKILELTLELGKAIPDAALVTFGAPKNEDKNPEIVQQIFQQIFNGNFTNSNLNLGDNSTQTNTVNTQGMNKDDFVQLLRTFKQNLNNSGLPEDTIEIVTDDIATVEKQLQKSEPNKAIVKTKLESINSLLDDANQTMDTVEKGNKLLNGIIETGKVLLSAAGLLM